jgi:ABC-type sulfate transport system permease subunit
MLIPVVIVLGAATLGILLVLVISLIRQVARLAVTLGEFQREVTPVLEQIGRDADRAGTRLQAIAQRRAAQERR